ncbi:hypothetical protein K461DRAFT_290598 [Myriangium duriaei CBS 260.36]|uniref:SUZ domain-containing protein n=1 Tax=Myriangium duriaei CBS 260.36 TaxID=1168546 RepID=A0A9P4MMV2_9PEZI|nr:hypothetical protein K461DRAFT_290598 [Myriangium duriaei CBS 260.36]
MSSDAVKPRLTFAKVAASANPTSIPKKTPRSVPPPQPQVAVPIIKPVVNTSAQEKATKDGELANTDSTNDADKFTPRQAKSTLVPGLIAASSLDAFPDSNSLAPQDALRMGGAAPVSEENVTKIPSVRPHPSTLSMDGKSTTSGTTFPLDEKESLRPDDSASVNANEDDDGRASTQPSSQVGSDSGARAFSEQLREISIMGPPPRQPAALAHMTSSSHGTPGVLFSPSPIAVPNAFAGVSATLAGDATTLPFPPDEKLLEALSSVRDRVWVLKLEQDITDFVKDPLAQSFDLPQCNSFYRMLAHKMADYYLLGHTMDASLSTVRLWKTPSCRIPPRLSDVTNPSTAASTPPPPMPQMKILRRNESGTRPSSREGVADGDSGSDGGKNKNPATREEREARYEAARLRILGSAKPTEDAAVGPPKDHDGSNSNSVVGKRKNRKQRTDSEDGFEARSAYSMYPQGGMPPQSQADVHGFRPQAENMPMPYNQSMPYGMPMQYGNGYGAQSPAPQPWYNGGYGQMPQQPPMWNQGAYGQYDMSAHMQSMSFHSPNLAPAYPTQMRNDMMGSPNFSSAMPMNGYSNTYAQSPPAYPNHYPAPSPNQNYTNGQPYQYGTLPAQGQGGGKRQNPNHPLPGSYNRQYFNPNSQAFVPGRSSSPYNRPPFPNSNISPAISHASISNPGPPNLQRQHSSQSNSPYIGPSMAPQQHTPLQHLVQPNPRTLTHPLPQPVFAQPSPPHNSGQQRVSPGIQQVNGTTPPSQQPPKNSGLAKYAGAGLPAKPPPPASETVRIAAAGR